MLSNIDDVAPRRTENTAALHRGSRKDEAFKHVVGLGQVPLNSLSVNKLDLPTPFGYLLYEQESRPASIRIAVARHPGSFSFCE